MATLEIIFCWLVKLTQVSFSLRSDIDGDVKKYVADSWVKQREKHAKLTRLYEQTKSELTDKLNNAEKVPIEIHHILFWL